MGLYAVKILVSAVLIVLISEIAKRSTLFGALIASIPITSLLAFIWLYLETGDSARIAALSTGVFWLVLPSRIFVVLPPGVAYRMGILAGLRRYTRHRGRLRNHGSDP
jgi:hypothetical protein